MPHRPLMVSTAKAACEHLSSPSIDRSVEHALVSSKQQNFIAAQNMWNEAGQLLNDAGGRPMPNRLPI